jgi:2-haloacid dehalogenase
MDGIKVLAFDTGGTILDWHSGIARVLAETGAARGVERDWHGFANEYRRRSLGRMLGAVDPDFTIDDVHREVLDEVLGESGIGEFSADDRRAIAQRWHELGAWPDFVPALVRLRRRYVCVSLTILSLSLVIDVSRRNAIMWDAVIPCEITATRVVPTQDATDRRCSLVLEDERHLHGHSVLLDFAVFHARLMLDYMKTGDTS